MASLAPSTVGTGHHQAVTRHLCRFLARDVDTALLLPGSDGRAMVEAFIAERFYREHDARIHTYLPALLSLSGERGYLAALGLGPVNYDLSGEAQENAFNELVRAVGPLLLGDIPMSGRRNIHWKAGYFVGLDGPTPDHSVRASIEFEF